jgi:hypothetical protein
MILDPDYVCPICGHHRNSNHHRNKDPACASIMKRRRPGGIDSPALTPRSERTPAAIRPRER